MNLEPETESVNDSCINLDFTFSSSQFEQAALALSPNLSTNQILHDGFSLESVNQDCLIKRETSIFPQLESYHDLYPNLFVDCSLYLDI